MTLPSFLVPEQSPRTILPQRVPDFNYFTMADAKGSWIDDMLCSVTWIDDLARPSSQRSTESSDPNHIFVSVETTSYDASSLVPSTVQKVKPEGTPVNGSVESGRAERWAHDGIWRLPYGSRPPRNIYNDPDCDYEGLIPSGDDDSSSSTALPPFI